MSVRYWVIYLSSAPRYCLAFSLKGTTLVGPLPETRKTPDKLVSGRTETQVADRKDPKTISEAARRNISIIARLERWAARSRTFGERIGDTIAVQAGRVWFILLHVLWFGGWIFWNVGLLTGLKPFDPYPFEFLILVVSLESTFLSLFILMSQNRSNRQAEQRAHLDLQVNLLSEQETTKLLQLVRALCLHHGLPEANDTELVQMMDRTRPQALIRELNANLPSETAE